MISEDTHFIGSCIFNAAHMICAAITKNERVCNAAATQFHNLIQSARTEEAPNDPNP